MVLKNKEDGKLCFKASQKKNRINKTELENMLMDEEIMGPQDVLSLRKARNTTYDSACKTLYEKGKLEEEEIKIENKDSIDCLDKNEITHKELVDLAKKHHLNYKGSRTDLCKRLQQIGYIFNDDDNIKDLSTFTRKCYKLKMNPCKLEDTCEWMPQIINKQKNIDKKLLIKRLETLDKINGKSPKKYTTMDTTELMKKLKNMGFGAKSSICKDKQYIYKTNPTQEQEGEIEINPEQEEVNNEQEEASSDIEEVNLEQEEASSDIEEVNLEQEEALHKLVTKEDCGDFIKDAISNENKNMSKIYAQHENEIQNLKNIIEKNENVLRKKITDSEMIIKK